MRYILDDNGYVHSVSCTPFSCADKSCTEYTGAIPSGYESIAEWAQNANIRAYKLVGGNFTFDAAKDAELQAQWATEDKNIVDCLGNDSSFAIVGSLLVCWGRVAITPSAKDTPTAKAIKFPKKFASVPAVVTSAVTAVPGKTVTGTASSEITVDGCDIYVTRANTTATSVDWVAIGGAL